MKKLIALICILFTTVKIFACTCDLQYTTNNFLRADFVAIAEIIKTHKSDKDFYKTEINIKELYKGNAIKSVNIDGYNKVKQWSSCDIKLIPGSKWLIFGFKNQKGKISSGYCSMHRADDYNFTQRKISFILATLKNNLNQLSKIGSNKVPYFFNNYKTFSGKKVGDYTLVSVNIDSNLNIEKIVFYTDDTQIAKNRIESELRKFDFKAHFIKNNINTKNGFFCIWELYPYTNIVEPDLRLH